MQSGDAQKRLHSNYNCKCMYIRTWLLLDKRIIHVKIAIWQFWNFTPTYNLDLAHLWYLKKLFAFLEGEVSKVSHTICVLKIMDHLYTQHIFKQDHGDKIRNKNI